MLVRGNGGLRCRFSPWRMIRSAKWDVVRVRTRPYPLHRDVAVVVQPRLRRVDHAHRVLAPAVEGFVPPNDQDEVVRMGRDYDVSVPTA